MRDNANTLPPPPVLLHPWKHHLHFIKENIINNSLDDLKAPLLTLGGSVMDLYTGSMHLLTISHEILKYLEQENVTEADKYKQWLGKEEYRLINISDNSTWTLRWAAKPHRHVHLHPARYSEHTIRIKANLLKTAILAVKMNAIDLVEINHLRVKYLNLSPLKTIAPGLKQVIVALQK